ncbi:MAG: aminotransferase class I/II-fold pyridoxal phosphate-dependent enzyme [Gemmatimonadetes bacterium]|nr:aminotransferase class I/II-fold pyridoxal phosphate-dependent enzyme [Gemmatimonadota bacterium]
MNRRYFMQRVAAGAGLASAMPWLSASRQVLYTRPEPRGAGGLDRRTLRLNANENPLGLPPSARQAILDGLVEANRYPFGPRTELTEEIARMHGVTPENIVLGNGSTEVLQMAVQALGGASARVLVAEPTFEDVPQYAAALPGLHVEKVPLRPDWAHDVARLRELSRGRRVPVLVYICNPNNPTATLTPSGEIDAWVAEAPEHVYFLVDEAYFHYVQDPSYWTALRHIQERPNVVVTRTFSKIYGMAGMRLGYAVARHETAERMRAFASDNNANHLVLVAARACLHDTGFMKESLELNNRARQVLYQCLDDLGLEYLPSHANFAMYRINGDLLEFIERMRERDVLVGRPFPPMLGYNRISIGLPEEMERFAQHLREFRRAGWV